MERYTVKTESYKGYDINIVQDNDPQNPRTEWDNLGTMVCWHRRYHLGDISNNRPLSSDYQGPDNLFAEIACIDIDSDYCTHIYDKQGDKALSSYLYKAASKKAVILPLYLYDHSGITMNTRGFSCGWDSGQVGYIYMTYEAIRKEYGWKTLTKKRLEKIAGYLTGEVETYDNFLTGEVYGFEVCEKGSGWPIDSCWGFYGSEGVKEATDQAKDSINYIVKKRIALTT